MVGYSWIIFLVRSGGPLAAGENMFFESEQQQWFGIESCDCCACDAFRFGNVNCCGLENGFDSGSNGLWIDNDAWNALDCKLTTLAGIG